MRLSEDQAVILLQAGDVVAVPTETVYGLAGDATRPSAIAKIFEIKKRPADNPLICHFHSISHVASYVREIPGVTFKLMNSFLPGPASFMLDLPENSPLRFATCGSDQVIVRIPDHPLFLSIIKKVGLPIAAPSANTSGKVSPTSAEMVEEDLGSKIPGVVDGGSSTIGLESTIFDARSATAIRILRRGAIGEKEIRQVYPEALIVMADNEQEAAIPGSRYRHYAPDIPVFLIEHPSDIREEKNAALLLTREQLENIPSSLHSILSAKHIHFVELGSLLEPDELARNFYASLAGLNRLNVDKAFFLNADFGSSSLGTALRNRLDRIISPR